MLLNSRFYFQKSFSSGEIIRSWGPVSEGLMLGPQKWGIFHLKFNKLVLGNEGLK